MRRLTTTLGVLLALALVIPAGAWAKRGGRGFRGRMITQLGLSPAQQQQLTELRKQHRARVRPVRLQKRKLRKELRALWQADSPDRAAILAKIGEMAALKAKLREARVDQRLAVRALLTPAQRQKARELRKRFKGRRHHRWGRRGKRGKRRGWGHRKFKD